MDSNDIEINVPAMVESKGVSMGVACFEVEVGKYAARNGKTLHWVRQRTQEFLFLANDLHDPNEVKVTKLMVCCNDGMIHFYSDGEVASDW